MNSNELLDALKAKTGAPSDFALARDVLNVHKTSVRDMRLYGLSDAMALQIATLLDIDPAAVLASVHAERAKDPAVRKVWEKLAKTIRAAAAGVLIVLGMGVTAPEPLQASQHLPRYTLCETRHRRSAWAALLAFLGLFSVTATAGDWNTQDTRFEAAYLVLHAVDWSQTRYIAAHPERFIEDNPILGEHPSDAEVNRYFLLTGLIHAGIAYALPSDWRRGFQLVTIGIEAGTVARNYRIGIRSEF